MNNKEPAPSESQHPRVAPDALVEESRHGKRPAVDDRRATVEASAVPGKSNLDGVRARGHRAEVA